MDNRLLLLCMLHKVSMTLRVFQQSCPTQETENHFVVALSIVVHNFMCVQGTKEAIWLLTHLHLLKLHHNPTFKQLSDYLSSHASLNGSSLLLQGITIPVCPGHSFSQFILGQILHSAKGSATFPTNHSHVTEQSSTQSNPPNRPH